MLLIVIICLPQPRLKEKDYFWLFGFLMYPYFIYSGYIFIEWKTTNVKELCVVFRLFLIRPRTISLTVIFNLVFPCVTTLQSAFTSCLLFLGHIFPLPPYLHPAAAHTQTCTDISSPSPSFCFQDDTLFFSSYFIYLFLETGEGKEKERERNFNVWLPLMCPHWGPGLQPRHVPWLGIKLVTLWFTSWHSIYWATPPTGHPILSIYYLVSTHKA